MTMTIEAIIRAVENLAERARTDKAIEAALAAVVTPLSSALVSAFEKYAARVRILESEVGPERAWLLIEAHDDLIDLISEDRPAQLEAVRRLARAMIPPKLGPVGTAGARRRAKEVGLDVENYLQGVAFPDGLIVAAARMNTPQRIRLGQKWVLDRNGKIAEVRPVYDLSVEKFIHWLYQEASQATDLDHSNRTYPDDPLNAITRPKEDSIGGEIAEVAIARPDLVVALFDTDPDPTQNRIIAAQSTKEAERQVSTLLRRSTHKERMMIQQALERDGDLSDLLREQGYKPAALRQIRGRLRRKLSE